MNEIEFKISIWGSVVIVFLLIVIYFFYTAGEKYREEKEILRKANLEEYCIKYFSQTSFSYIDGECIKYFKQ